MIIQCPQCNTTYNIPEDKIRPGMKMRCTVCKHVFPFEEKPADEFSIPSFNLDDLDTAGSGGKKRPAGKKKGKPVISLTLIVLMVLTGTGVYLYKKTTLLDPVVKPVVERFFPSPPPPPAQPAEDRVSLLGVRNMRQYTIPNEKAGEITVVEGNVANGFDEPRELIRLELTLYDAQGNPVVSKSQLAGTQVSLFQLQILGQAELEQALNNKLDILAKNTNVPPGGMVPFMLVVYNPPAEAVDFSVQIVDAKIPEKK